MAGVRIFESPVRAEWIDYNGHLRDAYYAVIFSEAIDVLMSASLKLIPWNRPIG